MSYSNLKMNVSRKCTLNYTALNDPQNIKCKNDPRPLVVG